MNQQGFQTPDDSFFLLGTVGDMAGRRFTIFSPRTIIGRDPTQCNLVFDLPIISKRHAMIEVDAPRRVTITDLGSSNGTYINNERITSRVLNAGDQIGFGRGGTAVFTYHVNPVQQARPAPRPVPAPLNETVKFDQDARAAMEAEQRVAGDGERPATMVSQFSAMDGAILRMGRAPDNQVVLEGPGVSRYHASLTYNAGQPMLADLGSKNGTFVNGRPITEPRMVTPNDLIFVGGFLLRVDGRTVKRYDLGASRINAIRITKTIGKKTIVKDVSIAIAPSEFVGLMGPTGCGKTTLLDALNGLRPATSGVVLINELDLYRNFDALRRSIGYVPQRDILHDALSVERTLYYAAKLRLPQSTPASAQRAVVDEVITMVALGEHRATPFGQLSGGQQKRLSLAIELITKPSFIFLDEPTSPLDPETTENMMILFRQLADEGRILVMVTHKFEKFDTMHQVAMLTRGGRLAYFGPPREALAYFGCTEPAEIYRRINALDPDQAQREFEASPQHARYVSQRLAVAQEAARVSGPVRTPLPTRGAERSFGLSQWKTLTRRYAEVKLKDARNTGLLLLQAPLIALILAIIVGDAVNDAKTLFVAAVISIWFGANNATREIVAEAPIYRRERLVNLKIPSYVFSKFAVLAGLALVQCVSFVGILGAFGRVRGNDFILLSLILYLTSLGGISMGLFFSALVRSSEKAMSVLPLILIPQLLLSGFLKPVDDIYVNLSTGRPRAVTVSEYNRAGSSTPPAIVTKTDGMGAISVVGGLMIARWSIEALAHATSISDQATRDLLPTRLTVAEYSKVQSGNSETSIKTNYLVRVALDLIILTAFAALFLILTMWALKRKDVL